MHLFISGKPGVGKTTLIKTLVNGLKNTRGFYTQEIRENSERVGFKVVTLSGSSIDFAHKRFKTPYKVSSYCVDVEALDRVATSELKEAISSDCTYIIIDEIGKMELFSKEFKRTVEQALRDKRVIATIPSKYENSFLKRVKKQPQTLILELKRDNFHTSLDKARLFLDSLDVERIRELEKKAKDMGLEERILIENASSNLFSVIENLNLGKNGLIIAGKGNNGADVLSCARKLLSRGYKLDIAVLADKEPNQEVWFQLSVLEKIKEVHFIKRESDLKILTQLCKDKDFILEGLLGIGLRGKPSPFVKKIIEAINKSRKKIVACDIPSGLSPQEGAVLGEPIKADFTITFIAPKKGFFLNQGLDFCGKIFVVDIGISREVLEKVSQCRTTNVR
jgi:hydroxyethylthiazole kinase-like uncharacterized protein yjeF